MQSTDSTSLPTQQRRNQGAGPVCKESCGWRYAGVSFRPAFLLFDVDFHLRLRLEELQGKRLVRSVRIDGFSSP